MKYLKVFLIIATCLGVTVGVVFAQAGGTLRGKITDVTPDQNPIEGVLVTITGVDAEFTTKTDADGNYVYAGLPAGRYLISTSKDGYGERLGKPVTITNGGTAFVSLKMTPKDGRVGQLFEEMIFAKPEQLSQEKMRAALRQQVSILLQRVAESVSARYELDTAFYPPAVLDAIVEHLEQVENLDVYARAAEEAGHTALLELLLSHPEGKAAFAEYLSETQLQDYVAYTARRHLREQEAVAHVIIAALDTDLSLSAAQRQKVKQLLLDAAGNANFPRAMKMLTIKAHQILPLVRDILKISMAEVLSESQSEVWEGFQAPNVKAEGGLIVRDIFEVPEAIANADGRGPIRLKEAINRVNRVNGVEGFQLFVPDEQHRIARIAESQENIRQLAAAKLAAHTERLGPLDENATRRLEIAMKGTVQQFLEAQDKVEEERVQRLLAQLGEKIENGEMLEGEAAKIAEDLTRHHQNILVGRVRIAGITGHPLYQETIKAVLSEEAFARYKAYQTERKTFRQQALGAVAVACMDTHLLLDDTQRQYLETATTKFTPIFLGGSTPSARRLFQLFRRKTYFERLTPWQQTEFERIFGPLLLRPRR